MPAQNDHLHPFDRSDQPGPAVEVDELIHIMAERLLEDERLRGDLTDDGYQPLLNWALLVVDRCRPLLTRAPSPDDAEAMMDDLSTAIRRVVQRLVRAAERADRSLAIQALQEAPDVLDLHPADDAVAYVSLTGDPDENARRLATALKGNNDAT